MIDYSIKPKERVQMPWSDWKLQLENLLEATRAL